MNPNEVTMLEVLEAGPGGLHADVGLRVAGQTQGPRIRMSASAMNGAAVALLSSGHKLHRAGAAPADMTTRQVIDMVDCTQLGVATTPSGEAVLMLGFGSLMLCAKPTPEALAQMLPLLQAAAQGALMTGSPTRQ
jgi:hypothetical protein